MRFGRLWYWQDYVFGASAFHTCQRYLEDSSVRIPLLIALREYYDADDCADLIGRFFKLECATNVQYSLFEDFLAAGRFLLLLDGFDEMGAKSNPFLRKANYLKLAPLVRNHSKVIISCRPAHFLSLEETKAVFASISGPSSVIREDPLRLHLYETVGNGGPAASIDEMRSALSRTSYANLELFSPTQIHAYLRKHERAIKRDSEGSVDIKLMLRRIRDIYDLPDLARRPIILKLIVSTLPLFRETPDGAYEVEMAEGAKRVPDITPSVLYDVYTENELEREQSKGTVRRLIAVDDKKRVIAAVGFEMFRLGAVAIDKDRLATIIEKHLTVDDANLAFYVTDIRTCRFLNRDRLDAVRFTHKSFMEYFAATSIKNVIESIKGGMDILSQQLFSDEVCYFLGDSIATSQEANVTTRNLISLYDELSTAAKPLSTPIENILNVLSYARAPLAQVNKVSIGSLNYRKQSLPSLSLEAVSLDVLRMIAVTAKTISIRTCEIGRWEAEGGKIHGMEILRSTVRTTRVWETHFEKMELTDSNWIIETWRAPKIPTAEIRSSLIIGDGQTPWVADAGTVEDSVLLNLDLTGASFDHVAWHRCTFVLCRIDDPSRVRKLKDSRGVFVTEKGEGDSNQVGPKVWSQGRINDLPQKFGASAAPTWEQLLVNTFRKGSPKSPEEVRNKLHQAMCAAALIKRKGERVVIESSNPALDGECRIKECTVQTVTVLNLLTKKQSTLLFRRLTVTEEGKTVRICVRGDVSVDT